MDKTEKGNIIVVSNRLPFIFKKGANGEIKVCPGAGGLVTAIAPILKDRGGDMDRLAGVCSGVKYRWHLAARNTGGDRWRV